MKKTLNINLGGMIFHIDEDAFNKLEAYLGALRQQFIQTNGGSEESIVFTVGKAFDL